MRKYQKPSKNASEESMTKNGDFCQNRQNRQNTNSRLVGKPFFGPNMALIKMALKLIN